MSKIKNYFIFMVRLKFQKQSAYPEGHLRLKFVSRIIPRSGGYSTQQATKLFPKLNLKFIPVMIIALIFYPFVSKGLHAEQSQPVIKQNVSKPASGNIKQSKSTLVITPQEVNLGIVSPEKSGEAILTFKKTGSGVIHWSTEGPEGWKKPEQQKLSGSLEYKSDSLRVEIQLLSRELLSNEDKQKNTASYVEMKLESGSEKIICAKIISAGAHKEEIKINSESGQQTICISFVIAYIQKSPLIKLNPLRLDMGSIIPEKTVSKKIILTNSGKEKLTWSVATRKHENENISDNVQQGRYISFINEETRSNGVYAVPLHLKGIVELTGIWSGKNGLPSIVQGENIIKINFSGTGIILYLSAYQKKGNLAISLDKQLIDGIDLFENIDENEGEILIADKLADGPHVLTITSKDSNMILEGVRILGVNTAFYPEKSIKIFPDSGATTRQTNYLTVSLNTGQMFPGYYKDDIVFTTNGGEAIVEVFAEVLPETISKIVDIYRYYNGSDYLFTADPQSETQRLLQNRYMKEGIAFRLFNLDTPGTASFYRWYNPQRKSHFYHYDYAGGKKDLRGYIFEGSIGNIATSKLTNTRELYRWYNSKTGHYFYSTDSQGGKIDKKKYRFDGIAGYVK